MIERRSSARLDLESRNERILVLYYRHIHRKKIALMMKMQYETVKKVIQKYHIRNPQNEPYQGIDSRKIVRQIESYDVSFMHSER